MTDLNETLLLEVHRLIEVAAKEAVTKLGSGPRRSRDEPLVTYPPTDAATPLLSAAEVDALNSLTLSAEARSGLERVVADAAASAFFSFFCLLDGAADPEVQDAGEWLGAELHAPSDDDDRPMLHDEFLESYWRYRELSQSGA